MRTISTTYHKHEFKRTVTTYCKSCRKKLRRIISDYFTMSPFNKLSYEENIESVKTKLDIEQKELEEYGVTCRKCELGE